MKAEELAKRYNFVKVAEDGVVEFYVDHSILSALRNCEAYFELTYLRNVRSRARNWNFDFGSWLHASLEVFYHHEFKKLRRVLYGENDCALCGHPISIHPIHTEEGFLSCETPTQWDSISKGTFIAQGLKLWDKMQMDYFVDKHKNFKVLGGDVGAAKLLSDYWNVYGEGKERLRVVGIELPFGRNKEVPIVTDSQPDNSHWSSGPYRGYLTGRIDLLIDDMVSISPMDHKSTAYFDGSESTKFMPHEGMQGYVLAADHMLKILGITDRRASRVVMNHVALQDSSNAKDKDASRGKPASMAKYEYDPARRFTRSFISYTPQQLEEFKIRQAASVDILYQILVLERPPVWNTSICTSMYHKECPFKDVHALAPHLREDRLKAMYEVVEQWNPFYESKAEI